MCDLARVLHSNEKKSEKSVGILSDKENVKASQT